MAALTGTRHHATIQLVLERDQCCCVKCGTEVTDVDLWEGWNVTWSLHHILRRQNGGNNKPSNLVTLCGTATNPRPGSCKAWVVNNPAAAKDLGLSVWSGTFRNPADHPVYITNTKYPDGEWLILHHDGTTDEVHDLEVTG